MTNSLQYEAAQVAPYLVAIAERLRHVNSGLVDLNSVKDDRDKLKTSLLFVEAKRHKFEEHYDLLACKNVSMEERVASLDGSVECLSHRIEVLVEEKYMLGS